MGISIEETNLDSTKRIKKKKKQVNNVTLVHHGQ